MNKLIYNLLNKTYNKTTLDEKNLQNLYQFYINKNERLNCDVYINKKEFYKIFTIIYDVLRFKLNYEEFEYVVDHYLKLLIADAIDGNVVNDNWFINHIWYLSVGISNDILLEKYKDCIMFIQEKLIKEFNIEESIKDKVGRKIYTKFMIK